jgi:hypothetical protein
MAAGGVGTATGGALEFTGGSGLVGLGVPMCSFVIVFFITLPNLDKFERWYRYDIEHCGSRVVER